MLTTSRAVLFRKLRADFAANPDIGVAAIFCSYQDRENQTTPNLIGAVWRQLASEPALTEVVRRVYDEKSSKHQGHSRSCINSSCSRILDEGPTTVAR